MNEIIMYSITIVLIGFSLYLVYKIKEFTDTTQDISNN